MKKEKYDPYEVNRYYSKTFITKSGSRYNIDFEGRFHGGRGIDGAKVEMICSGGKELYKLLLSCIYSSDRKRARKTILRLGKRAKIGNFLALTLIEEDSMKYGCTCLVTSRIEEILEEE